MAKSQKSQSSRKSQLKPQQAPFLNRTIKIVLFDRSTGRPLVTSQAFLSELEAELIGREGAEEFFGIALVPEKPVPGLVWDSKRFVWTKPEPKPAAKRKPVRS